MKVPSSRLAGSNEEHSMFKFLALASTVSTMAVNLNLPRSLKRALSTAVNKAPRKRFHRTRKLFKYSLIAGGAGGTVGYGIYSYDPGFKRQCDFYVRAFPVFAHYKWMELTHYYLYEPEFIPFFHSEETLDEKYEKLHQKYSQYILDVILKLKGLYVKAGQFATSRPDVTPPSWIDKLRTLQVSPH